MRLEWIRRAGVRTALVTGLAAAGGLVHCKKDPVPDPTASEAQTGGGPTITAPEVAYSDDPQVVERGEQAFAQKGCNACHKIGGGKLVGPDLKGVTARRDKQWLAKMILHPDQMVKSDPIAIELFKTHLTPMPNQGVTEEELVAIMSYLKANE